MTVLFHTCPPSIHPPHSTIKNALFLLLIYFVSSIKGQQLVFCDTTLCGKIIKTQILYVTHPLICRINITMPTFSKAARLKEKRSHFSRLFGKLCNKQRSYNVFIDIFLGFLFHPHKKIFAICPWMFFTECKGVC